MRTRIKSIPGKGRGKAYFGFSADSRTAEYDVTDKTVVYERIDDVNNRRERPQSPCSHTLVSAFQVPVSNWSRATHSPYGQGVDNAYPMVDASQIADLLVRPDLVELRQAANNKVIAELASVAKRWSSFNDLLELGEIPDLMRRGNKLKNGYLTVEFGWLPVLRWMESLHDALSSFRDRLAQLRKQSGVRTRFNFKLNPGIEVPAHLDLIGFNTKLFPERYHCVARTTGYVTIDCPALDDAFNNLNVALDVLGLHPDILTVYDATRFSWLLDWFLPIGDYLEQFTDRRWIRPNIVAAEGSLSYRVDGFGRLKQVPDVFYPDLKEEPFGTVRFKVYHRESFQASTNPLDFVDPRIPIPRFPRLTPEQMLVMWGLLDPGAKPITAKPFSLKPRLKKKRR